MSIIFDQTEQKQLELSIQEEDQIKVDIEENIVLKQRQQQRTLLLQKIEESLENVKEKDYDELIKLKQYVFWLYTYFENEWKDFNTEGDLEIGNCYKFCINKLNIFKNILRSFFSYMKNKGDDIVIECLDSFQKPIQKVKKQFIRFSERHPANNKSMQVLFEYDRYGRQFEYFLNFYAVDWLIKSKVKDLIPHLLSIFFLLRCFQTPQLKDQLKVYKKTKKITLPRKVRKSKIAQNKNDKEDSVSVKCEEVSSMQLIDSFNPSVDSFTNCEDNKSICYTSSINESQSITSSSYQENQFLIPFPQKQFSFEEIQNQSQNNKNFSLDFTFNESIQEREICNCFFDCQQKCLQFKTNISNNESKQEYFEDEIFNF